MNVMRSADAAPAADPAPFIRTADDGTRRLDLAVQGLHCAGCIAKIEDALKHLPGIEEARVNMSTQRLSTRWSGPEAMGAEIVETVTGLGYGAAPFDPGDASGAKAAEGKRLLIALGVAGFAAANVMLLSISVWAGSFTGMEAVTRDLFHWLSALIALPAIAYAGMPFFASAARVLRRGTMNMDVPISLAVVLAAGVSLYETWAGGPHAYFDAAITLLFFLLVGRYLDHRARAAAQSTAEHLLALQGSSARVIEGGVVRTVAARDVMPGARVLVAAGERVPVDGEIVDGRSDLDTSLVTGETAPSAVAPGALVHAGTLNLGGALTIQTTAAGEDTLLAEIVRLMEAAEQGQAKYVRIADRVARIYAPAVHVAALGTFLGWWLITGVSPAAALLTAVAVLIITCPCALGLAVPVVQVVASGRLMRKGILVKSGDALERLTQIDTVVFDKTGTLTLGRPSPVRLADVPADELTAAAALARHSRHPLARTLAKAVPGVEATEVVEHPGLGLVGRVGEDEVRLGSRDWCGAPETPGIGDDHAGPEMWVRIGAADPVRLRFADAPRADARETVETLKAMGLGVHLLSGDRAAAAERIARELGIETWRAECRPDAKIAYLEDLAAAGQRVLMVGDGLNDGPALAAAHASMSPASAADISQTAADVVFQGDGLAPVAETLRVAHRAGRLVKQNFALAFVYNAVAVPIAMAGLATPLVAAVAMSSSSLVVTLNALRLKWVGARGGHWGDGGR